MLISSQSAVAAVNLSCSQF